MHPAAPRRVIYPGSFDPIHLGHVDVVEQAADLFGEVVVAIMHNHAKPSGLFSVEQRIELAQRAVEHVDGARVVAHSGLAVQAAVAEDADFFVKGLRSAADFDIEQQMAHNNLATAGIRTVYLPSAPSLTFISSRFVREIAKYGEPIGHLVPSSTERALLAIFPQDAGEATE